MLILILSFFSFFAKAEVRTPPFEKWIDSKQIKVSCTGKINDTFIFSINLKDQNQAHEFMVMSGLEPELCVLLRNKVKRVLKTNKFVLVSGYSGSNGVDENVLVHQWKLVRGKHTCVSYLENDCLK